MSTTRNSDWYEKRRYRAIELKRKKWAQSKIAEALGVSPGAVSQWVHKANQGGKISLRSKARPGAPAKLSPKQLDQMLEYISYGAETYGFYGDIWTCARIATMIENEFGVQYHKSHVSRIMKRLGITPQKPVILASQRNEAEIEKWRKEVWPHLKKSQSKGKNTDSPR